MVTMWVLCMTALCLLPRVQVGTDSVQHHLVFPYIAVPSMRKEAISHSMQLYIHLSLSHGRKWHSDHPPWWRVTVDRMHLLLHQKDIDIHEVITE